MHAGDQACFAGPASSESVQAASANCRDSKVVPHYVHRKCAAVAEVVPPDTKRCSCCTIVKPNTEFHKDKTRDCGLHSRCNVRRRLAPVQLINQIPCTCSVSVAVVAAPAVRWWRRMCCTHSRQCCSLEYLAMLVSCMRSAPCCVHDSGAHASTAGLH